MYKSVAKIKEYKSRAVANSVGQRKREKEALGLVDNRPETKSLQSLQSSIQKKNNHSVSAMSLSSNCIAQFASVRRRPLRGGLGLKWLISNSSDTGQHPKSHGRFHEHFMFDTPKFWRRKGRNITDIGYGGNGLFDEQGNTGDYQPAISNHNDADIVRGVNAVAGNWGPGTYDVKAHNCQHFVKDVLAH